MSKTATAPCSECNKQDDVLPRGGGAASRYASADVFAQALEDYEEGGQEDCDFYGLPTRNGGGGAAAAAAAASYNFIDPPPPHLGAWGSPHSPGDSAGVSTSAGMTRIQLDEMIEKACAPVAAVITNSGARPGYGQHLATIETLERPETLSSLSDWFHTALEFVATMRRHGYAVYIQDYVRRPLFNAWLKDQGYIPSDALKMTKDELQQIAIKILKKRLNSLFTRLEAEEKLSIMNKKAFSSRSLHPFDVDGAGTHKERLTRQALAELPHIIHKKVASRFIHRFNTDGAHLALLTIKEDIDMEIVKLKLPDQLLETDQRHNRMLVKRLLEALVPIQSVIGREMVPCRIVEVPELQYNWRVVMDTLIESCEARNLFAKDTQQTKHRKGKRKSSKANAKSHNGIERGNGPTSGQDHREDRFEESRWREPNPRQSTETRPESSFIRHSAPVHSAPAPVAMARPSASRPMFMPRELESVRPTNVLRPRRSSAGSPSSHSASRPSAVVASSEPIRTARMMTVRATVAPVDSTAQIPNTPAAPIATSPPPRPIERNLVLTSHPLAEALHDPVVAKGA